MGWRERAEKIINFRLIEYPLDGHNELRKFLGLPTPGGINTVRQKPPETVALRPPDEITLKMVDYLKNGRRMRKV